MDDKVGALDNIVKVLPVQYEGELDRLKKHRAIYNQTGHYYADYFLRFAIHHRDSWSELEAEYTNLLSAAQYCQDSGKYEDLLSLRDALQPYLDFQGHWADSLALNEAAIAAAQAGGDQESAARFTHDRADILHQLGEYGQAAQLYGTSEQMYLRLDNKERAIASRHMRALVVRAQGRLAEADQLCESVITDAHQLGLHAWIAHPLYVRALLARDRGDFQQARRCIEDSLNRLSDEDEVAMIAQCYHFLGELTFLQGNLSEARPHLEKSLQLSQSVGILRRVAATLRLLGDVTRVEGDYDEASRLYREALELARQLDDQPQQARILLSQAQLRAALGQKQKAIALLQNTLALYQKIGDPRNAIAASLLLVRLYLGLRHFRPALQQVGAIISTMRKARLLQPRLLIGIWRRRGKW